ncbi:unnamed protein product [Clavelina lepadiformis]|uniref:Peptidase S1 domain-containing protein n=1 Tax=Clavelina lepadiformis TaxID=159417 RepID=A0ABP0GYS1_CLALP
MIGTAWVYTGWSVVGGTLFIFGFLFYYELTPPVTTPSTPTTSPVTLDVTEISTFTPDVTLTTKPSFTQCGIPPDELQEQRSASPSFNVILDITLSSRILGGFVAVDRQWPWVVYIYEKDINGDTSNQTLLKNGLCGGTLLNDEWILTAAHCFTTIDPALYGVVLGEHTITETSGREIRRDVEELIIFVEYNQITFDNDVALIKVSRPITFNQNIRPSCLALPETLLSPATICTILGWGFTTSPMGLRQNQLMQVNLPIFPDDACRDLTGMNSAEYNFRTFNIGDPKICAGGETGKDSCNGDSGGPLLCLENGVYVVHGIVSYGSKTCGLPLLPGIYSKVSDPDINKFITDNIGTFNL